LEASFRALGSRIRTQHVFRGHNAARAPNGSAYAATEIAARVGQVHTTRGRCGIGASGAEPSHIRIIAGSGMHEAKRTAPVHSRLAPWNSPTRTEHASLSRMASRIPAWLAATVRCRVHGRRGVLPSLRCHVCHRRRVLPGIRRGQHIRRAQVSHTLHGYQVERLDGCSLGIGDLACVGQKPAGPYTPKPVARSSGKRKAR
jgi:hypothetical protein